MYSVDMHSVHMHSVHSAFCSHAFCSHAFCSDCTKCTFCESCLFFSSANAGRISGCCVTPHTTVFRSPSQSSRNASPSITQLFFNFSSLAAKKRTNSKENVSENFYKHGNWNIIIFGRTDSHDGELLELFPFLTPLTRFHQPYTNEIILHKTKYNF